MIYKKPTKAIITDAGFASRYLPITKTIPKAMLPLGNRPIMQLVVEECIEAGIEEIIIVATPEGKHIYDDYFHNPVEKIEKLLTAQGKKDRFEPVKKVLGFPKVTVIEQDQSLPYGNGSPIASAREYIDDNEAFIVAYSDDVVFGSSDVKTLIDAYMEHDDAKAIIIAQEMPHEVMNKYGAISLRDESQMTLEDIIEKSDDAPSNLASYGRYLLTPEVFQHLDPKNIGKDGELWTVDAITRMAASGNVYVEKTKGTWMTTGDPKNYFMAHLKYVNDYEDYSDEVKDFIAKEK
ncbi:NTP transferase domain-containing protein [Candidatus Saccharibacteria bacterium]|nr:NTP transferase domain-containing protein [Candidatus Saccharibacteria bacterium]